MGSVSIKTNEQNTAENQQKHEVLQQISQQISDSKKLLNNARDEIVSLAAVFNKVFGPELENTELKAVASSITNTAHAIKEGDFVKAVQQNPNESSLDHIAAITTESDAQTTLKDQIATTQYMLNTTLHIIQGADFLALQGGSSTEQSRQDHKSLREDFKKITLSCQERMATYAQAVNSDSLKSISKKDMQTWEVKALKDITKVTTAIEQAQELLNKAIASQAPSGQGVAGTGNIKLSCPTQAAEVSK